MLNIKRVDIESIHFDPNNARKHDKKNLDAIKGSLAKFGQVEPLVVHKKNQVVIGGNGRLAAMKELGWKEVDIVEAELDDFQASALALALNRTAELAEWDTDILSQTLKDLVEVNFDIGEIGFDDDFIKIEDVVGETDPDAVPENVETRCKPGDLWILGNHRLLCGDSTNVQHVERLMGGEKADMVFTDPPYNYEDTNRGSGAWGEAASKVGKRIEHISKFEPVAFLNVLPGLFGGNFCAYVFCNTALVRNYLNWALDAGLRTNILTWHKTQFIPTNSNHHFPDTEYCIYIADRAIFNSGLSPDHYRKYWIEEREILKEHPTVKPQAIITKCVELNSNAKGLVVDLFLGSGSTLIACEKTNRKCYGMEIDPHYCSVVLERWEKFTGQKAVLYG